MRTNAPPRALFLLVFATSLIPRLIGALWLPNAFGDAYAYTEQIYYMRRAILSGSFSVSNLFGFWLPLYQLICAAISAVIGSPFYVPKLVSAVAGAGVCVLVSLLGYDLTHNKWLSIGVGSLVALNPYHIFYSSSAMTDVPHAFFILLCAYCCIRDHWLLASLCALAAGLMRIESWTLIPLIPLAQYLKQSAAVHRDSGLTCRRPALRSFLTSIAVALILVAGPLFWLYVSWKTTGNLGKYFEIRNNYIVETLAANPSLAGFSAGRVAFDFLRLFYTANPLLMYAAITLLVIAVRLTEPMGWTGDSFFTKSLSRLCNVLATTEGLLLMFFFSHLAFLLLAYFTNNQPEIWPRYGLIFFTLGLPLLASLACRIRVLQTQEREQRTLPTFLRKGHAVACVAGAFFALQFCVQLVDVTRMTVKSDPNVVTAEFLGDQIEADPSTRIYCEDGAIRVLSGIPLEEFKDQYNSPAADDNAFLESLRTNQIRFLVYKDLPGSRLKAIIARIRTQTRSTGITLEEIIPKRKNTKDAIVVYRIHDGELAKTERKSSTTRYRRQ